MAASIDTLAQAMARRRRRHAEDDGPPVRAIPGYGQFVGPYNVGHGPTYDNERQQHRWGGSDHRPTMPTPGSAFGKRRPRWN